MANNSNEEFPSEIRAAFDAYPRPTGNDEFDARFWRELDSRQNRYRGIIGVTRRILEVEIEGIAVWRLGVALFGGAAVCGLGVALLSLSSSPLAPMQNAPLVAQMPTNSLASPRYARELWDDRDYEYRAPQSKFQPEKPKAKEEISCVSFARDMA